MLKLNVPKELKEKYSDNVDILDKYLEEVICKLEKQIVDRHRLCSTNRELKEFITLKSPYFHYTPDDANIEIQFINEDQDSEIENENIKFNQEVIGKLVDRNNNIVEIMGRKCKELREKRDEIINVANLIKLSPDEIELNFI